MQEPGRRSVALCVLDAVLIKQRHIGLLVLFHLKPVVRAALRAPGDAGAAVFFADSPSWCCRCILLGFADPSYELRCGALCGGFVW